MLNNLERAKQMIATLSGHPNEYSVVFQGEVCTGHTEILRIHPEWRPKA